GETNGNGQDDDGNGFIDDYYGWDFRYNDSDPLDEHGHGTHTGGTIGAAGNNGLGVVGVNWNVRIMAIKIYSSSGADTTSAMLINSYQYVLLMKNRGVNIRVTNNSYGGCNEACGYDQATKDAIDALGNAGILNVFAAGNSGTNNDVSPFYPATYTSPSIVSVGATNSSDARFYNFGLNSVDLAAPGVGIRSTYSTSNSSYGGSSGTSMATPHVAGAAALLAAHNPSLSAASLKATLLNSVDALPQLAGFYKTGGRLNVANALQNQTVCSFVPSASSINVPTKGGYFSVNVTTGINCDYSVKSMANWVKIESSDVMSGNGTVSFRVRLNPAISRSGTISVGGQTVTVTQSRN
ncbi:MAG: S8 family serine peptidase, partial [Blastocatellia bacterium]